MINPLILPILDSDTLKVSHDKVNSNFTRLLSAINGNLINPEPGPRGLPGIGTKGLTGDVGQAGSRIYVSPSSLSNGQVLTPQDLYEDQDVLITSDGTLFTIGRNANQEQIAVEGFNLNTNLTVEYVINGTTLASAGTGNPIAQHYEKTGGAAEANVLLGTRVAYDGSNDAVQYYTVNVGTTEASTVKKTSAVITNIFPEALTYTPIGGEEFPFNQIALRYRQTSDSNPVTTVGEIIFAQREPTPSNFETVLRFKNSDVSLDLVKDLTTTNSRFIISGGDVDIVQSGGTLSIDVDGTSADIQTSLDMNLLASGSMQLKSAAATITEESYAFGDLTVLASYVQTFTSPLALTASGKVEIASSGANNILLKTLAGNKVNAIGDGILLGEANFTPTDSKYVISTAGNAAMDLGADTGGVVTLRSATTVGVSSEAMTFTSDGNNASAGLTVTIPALGAARSEFSVKGTNDGFVVQKSGAHFNLGSGVMSLGEHGFLEDGDETAGVIDITTFTPAVVIDVSTPYGTIILDSQTPANLDGILFNGFDLSSIQSNTPTSSTYAFTITLVNASETNITLNHGTTDFTFLDIASNYFAFYINGLQNGLQLEPGNAVQLAMVYTRGINASMDFKLVPIGGIFTLVGG